LLAQGLANLCKEGREGAYAVRHGQQPVRDFGRPRAGEVHIFDPSRDNYFVKAFPVLFPYGRGGLEADRETLLSLADHTRWAMLYHDRRFRINATFAFVSFSIQQRRQALNSARIQIRQRNFNKDAALIGSVTVEKLQEAASKEGTNESVDDPAIKALRKHIHATGGRVMGSDQARYKFRSQIWSTSLVHGPPTLWITINPNDVHDPVAQIFSGVDIDMDAFVNTQGPDGVQRGENIAKDPYAAAKFFHFTIDSIIDCLYGVKSTTGMVKQEMGVLGKLAAYFGTVESQGRGTLHLHLLVWLQNTPTSVEINHLLDTPEYRQRVTAYIKENIRAYLPGLESKESIDSMRNESDIAFSRPPNPADVDWKKQVSAFECRVARAMQYHTCAPRRCLIPNAHGQYVCKRRAPFETSETDTVEKDGKVLVKRLYENINAWNPAILVNIRCNNDIKFLSNGSDTKNISFYITSYAAKKQSKSHNLSAILAKGFAYHQKQSAYHDEVRHNQQLLLFRLIEAINREQEIAAPMLMSYLMGWGDSKTSHQYAPIYLSGIRGVLLKEIPSLNKNIRSVSMTDNIAPSTNL
jgi:hypothetical protein